MKYLKFKYLCLATACLVVASFASCSDDDPSEFRQKFYLSKGVNPFNTEEVKIANNLFTKQVTNNAAKEYKFIARSTMPAGRDIKAIISAEESLIEAYNKANGTAYILLPQSCYELTKSSATIAQGSYASTDSLIITMKELGSELTNPGGYLLPLNLSALDGASTNDVSSNRNAIYIKFSVELTYQGILEAKGTEALNATAIDRSSWLKSCSTTPYDESYAFAYLFDGNSSTCFFHNINSASDINIDLRSKQGIKGFSFTAGYGKYGYKDYALRSMRISVSDDGTMWKNLGTVDIEIPETSTPEEPFINYVAMKEMQNAQFVRILPTRAFGSYVNFSELNIYK